MLLSRLVILLLCVAALLAAALPSPLPGIGGLRDAPLMLALLALGLLLGSGPAVVGAFVLGLGLDVLLHLPLGSYALPAGVFGGLLALLRAMLLRQPLWQQLLSLALLLVAYELVQTQWLLRLGDFALSAHWLPPLLAAAAWAPLALLARRNAEGF